MQTISAPALGTSEFRALREIIFDEVGIRLDDLKHALVETRIARRLRDLQLGSFGEYVSYLREQRGGDAERQALINAITTNKTDFFREPHHFRVLEHEVFPELMARVERGGSRPIRIWSAGCSSGEEPYTLAMTALAAGLDHAAVQIIATDVDTDVLALAKQATYSDDRVDALAPDVRRRFFLRGKGSDRGSWRVKSEVASLVQFRPVNLVKPNWPPDGLFDAIFCRNVIIYFDRPTQQRLFERFADHLHDGGYLFLGHSESLVGLCERFETMQGTVHRCVAGGRSSAAKTAAPWSVATARIVVGEVFASQEPTLVTTVLGSCVAACLFDSEARIGGMNHFLLPETVHDDGPLTTRYGVHAMERLINDLLRLGAQRGRLKAKVFGASTIGNFRSEVQARNARFVRTFLDKESIPLVAERLLGKRALEVRFRTDTGQAFVRPLSKVVPDLASRERTAMSQLIEQEIAGASEIDLFE